MRLQVPEEASLQSVILASIHCLDRVGEEGRGLMLCKCMHACMQKKRHFHRINIHYKQQHSTCILNRSLPNATVHPGCNRGSTFYKLLNSWGLVYYYCLSQNILHYTQLQQPSLMNPVQQRGAGQGDILLLRRRTLLKTGDFHIRASTGCSLNEHHVL